MSRTVFLNKEIVNIIADNARGILVIQRDFNTVKNGQLYKMQ